MTAGRVRVDEPEDMGSSSRRTASRESSSQEFSGPLPADKLEQIQARLFEYTGLTDDDA